LGNDHVIVGGAKVSALVEKYSWIPACALRRIAKRFGDGAKYNSPDELKKFRPKFNWMSGDEEYFAERLNHGLRHLFLWMDGDRSEDHLAAVGWMVCALMWAEEQGIIK
jgi:hypothetical protein